MLFGAVSVVPHLRAVRHLCSLLFVTTLVPCVMQGQIAHGPRIGVGMATINAGQFFRWTGLPKFGLIAGYSFDMIMSDQMSLMLEPMYVGKGSFVQAAQYRQTTRTTLHYVEVPIVLKISVNKNPQGLFLGGGIIPGYLIRGTERITQDGQELIDRPISEENLRRTQFSLCLGLGFEKGPLEMELRGENSVTPFDPVIRRQNLLFGLHVTFRFRPKPEEEEKEDAEEDYFDEK